VDANPRSRARAARLQDGPSISTGQRPRVVRVEAVVAERAVAGRHAGRQEVGELGERGLAEDDCARAPQLSRDEGVVWRERSFEGDRTRGRRHVDRVDVVLEEDGHAVERAAAEAEASEQIEPPGLEPGEWADVK